jgi:hypothetical protein
LWEEVDVDRVDKKILLGWEAPIVNIQNISDRLKGVKRDPDRKNQVERERRQFDAEEARCADKITQQKIEIFEGDE